MSSEQGRSAAAASALLRQFLAAPRSAAVLTDVDGTLAPIVQRPEQAAVPAQARRVLERLFERYGLVGCISGRQALEARRLVGLDLLAYAGNHGLELLLPGDERARPHPALRGRERQAAEFVAELGGEDLSAHGLRLEDKGAIQALHWRGAGDEAEAEARAEQIGAAAERSGLLTHRGRKVLELRPPLPVGKDLAVEALLSAARRSPPPLAGERVELAIYAGDDRTDLDAFAQLRRMRDRGELGNAVCVGVVSAEAPPELAAQADLTVDGPAGWLEILEALAG